MTNKYGEMLFVNTQYRPDSGNFSKPKEVVEDRYKVGNWVYCRDLFHGQLYNLRLFFFSHEPTKGYHIASFMRKVEDLLDVYPRSDFGPTQRKTIMWIKPSRWWTIKTMRRSLFTILLRSADFYLPNKDNFEEALFSDLYALQTKHAVNRFFAGYTHYIGRKRGWVRQFYESNLSPEQIDSLLVKP